MSASYFKKMLNISYTPTRICSIVRAIIKEMQSTDILVVLKKLLSPLAFEEKVNIKYKRFDYLKPSEVEEARKLFVSGNSAKFISEKFNVNVSSINRYLTDKGSHVGSLDSYECVRRFKSKKKTSNNKETQLNGVYLVPVHKLMLKIDDLEKRYDLLYSKKENIVIK